MKLLIDIGNTRIKWAMLRDGELTPQQAVAYEGWTAKQVRDCVLARETRPQAVWASNVGGDAIARAVSEAAQQCWSLMPNFVRSTAALCGVTNAYAQPQQLGVDRLLAVIGAYRQAKGAACVASIGTAATVDGVTKTGQHLGGVIAPGPDMMIASLLKNTSDIAQRASASASSDATSSSLFASNTLSGVQQGAAYALAALVERALDAMREQLGESPPLFLTGGAAERVASALRAPYRLTPDLVLRGLAAAADQQ